MAVYVDTPFWRDGRGFVCHMVADRPDELIRMARRLGLWPNGRRHKGTPKEHYVIQAKRRHLALAQFGALPVTTRELVAVIRRKRAAMKEREGQA